MDGQLHTWSPQQAHALDAAASWLREAQRGGPLLFRLFGYAGTGKTTLARHLAAGLSRVCYAAFTGKAALMMRRAGCTGATTIHSLIYTPTEMPDGTVEFILNRESAAADADLIVIDECSMVDAALAHDILSFKKPVLVLGDPAQLPPVGDAGYFTEAKPDVMLTEIHRQARDNPIIYLATRVREGHGVSHGTYGDSLITRQGVLDEGYLLKADQVLVGRNVTRNTFNVRLRRAMGRAGLLPEKGDRLVCLKNDRDLGLFNGGMFDVSSTPPRQSRPNFLRLKIKSEEVPDRKPFMVQVRREFFLGGVENLSWKELKHSQQFDYGYALTCHKAQGSQWPHVVVYDESGVFRGDAARWLYTAITRASERLTLVA